ncbi:MAG TPA: signal recognition particle-docking protein FtsY [Microvirga sp.]|jgi:fused signal recognition particle receptor|nr:signal recognition particle-docking protein FtsY [Microvirga sp.]
MAETKPDKPGFLSRLFGRKGDAAPESAPQTPEAGSRPEAESHPEAGAHPAEARPEAAGHPQAGGHPETMPSPPTTGADDLAAAPSTVTAASPDTPDDGKTPPQLAGADLQPVEGVDPEGGNPKKPVPRIVTETGPEEPQAKPPAAEMTASPAPESKPAAARGWWQRLTEGMRRTSSSLSESVTGLFTKRKLDDATLEELEDALIRADLGVPTALRITEAISSGRYNKEISPQEVRTILAGEVEKTLQPVAHALTIDRTKKPFVILMVGVNGAGKTTTIGKLSQKFRGQGLTVMLAAGDTFRAAAIEQLKIWGERVGAPVLAREQGADAAGLAFDALQEARAGGTDVLLVDTAGRLQNKTGLMAELEKIVRVMKKFDETAPHATLLVLDATVGQNAISQVELFQKAAGVTGLVMTKLDGTARGGILVALAARFGLPVHFIGVGEGVEDLEPFAARDFAHAIAGLEA